MRKRKYTRRIEVWNRQSTSDGFGGFDENPVKLSDSWCSIRSINANNVVDIGLDITSAVIQIDLRYRTDLDYRLPGVYFVYKGKEYVPRSVDKVDDEEEKVRIIAEHTT